jgi:CHAT domain-containing protein
MDIDPRIFFVIAIPDGQPTGASPMQGFAMSLCRMSWVIRAAALLPTSVYDLTDEGREVLLARRMSGTSPVNWYGQSPRAIRSMPHPPFVPFTLIVLPESESPADYEAWAESSSLRPTIVAKSGADLGYEDITLEGLRTQLLDVCDRIPGDVSRRSVENARKALGAWKPMAERKLDYQVGGHNSITPNLVALSTAGFVDMVFGRFKDVNSGLKPYVDQIVLTTNSVLDQRKQVGQRDLQRIFPKPPDLNLFAPAIYPDFFKFSLSADLDREEKKRIQIARQALMRQTGYNFEARSTAQQSAIFRKVVKADDGKVEMAPNPLMLIRARELSLCTELMSAVTASEFSAVVRLPNEVNRTLGSVRNFSEHFHSNRSTSRKRLRAFRQVQDRLAGAVPIEFMDLIRRSETGIRIVSDAHLEWLDLDGLPLAIRKNCTRIPVTPGNLFVDQLATKPLLHLTPEHFKSILLISALSRDDPISSIFKTAFDAFEPQWHGHLTMEFAEVASEEDLVRALNHFDGPMLIFDGHGSHSKDEPAKLHLGSDAVDVWSLKDKITNIPPIVILSACDTHAADRNHATTANGFMHLGARTVLSSVFPLDARSAAMFTARLVYRVSAFLAGAIATFGEALTWTEVISGMLRMQLLTDFLRLLLSEGKIDDITYERVHMHGNVAINGRASNPFDVVLSRLEETGLSRKDLDLELEIAVANSSVISYLQIGRPETILIDDRDRMKEQIKHYDQIR